MKWNLSKSTLFGTRLCVPNRQVFIFLQVNLTKIPTLWIYSMFGLYRIMSPPHFGGETYCFCPVCLFVTQFVSATPLKLLNRISWNLVGSKDTICSCAYYQEILISWILWELFANTSVISLTETCVYIYIYIYIYVQESIIMSLFPWKSFHHQSIDFRRTKLL